MQNSEANHLSDKRTAQQIEALLSMSDQLSIVDRLLALPKESEAAVPQDEWDLAVSQRLQTRIVQRMRTVLGEHGSRDAA